MFCRECGQEIQDESRFCNFCGVSQADPSSPPAPVAPLQPAVQGSPPPEKELWKGGYSGWAMAHRWFLWFFWCVLLAVLWLTLLPVEWKEYSWLVPVVLGAMGVPALLILFSLLMRKLTIRYRLTSHRLFVDRGFFVRESTEIELVRVDDVSVSQNLFQRIFNVGRVTLYSTDASDPRIIMEGIDKPVQVKESIRKNVRAWRDRALHMESL